MRVKTASVAHLVQSINNIVTSFSHNHFINSLLEGERTFFRRVMMCSKQKCSAIKYQGRLIWNVFYAQRQERRSCCKKVKAKTRKTKISPKKDEKSNLKTELNGKKGFGAEEIHSS